LVTRADYAGTTIRAPYSKITYDGWRTLGARPVDLPVSELAKAADGGRETAAESGYEFARGFTQRSTATGNVTPFARIDVLAAATGAWAELDARDRDVVQRAAADMTRHALSTGRTDAQLARDFCAAGGRVIRAPENDVSTITASTAPVVDRLEREPRTRQLIDEIRSWQAEPTEPAASCGNPTRAAPPAPARRSTSIHELDGVYRVNWPDTELLNAGVSADYTSKNSGVQTLTLRGGRYTWHQENGKHPPDCHGPYRIRGHTLWLDMNVETCTGAYEATWSLKGDELWLSLQDAIADDAIWWGAKPWRRIAH
jgi:hypothetical protein